MSRVMANYLSSMLDIPIKDVLPDKRNRRVVAQSRFFQIQALDLLFTNGESRAYERLTSTGAGAVMVVALKDEKTALLINEYVAGVDRYEWGLPKGKVERGEDLVETANRELIEEAGYRAAKLTLLKAFTIAPGYLEHETHLVLAEQLTACRAEGDEPEDIPVAEIALDRLYELAQRADCTEARSIAALYFVRDFIASRLANV